MSKLYPDYYDDDESIRPDPEDELPADVHHYIIPLNCPNDDRPESMRGAR